MITNVDKFLQVAELIGFRFQVSGEVQREGTIHFLLHTLTFPQLTASDVLALKLSVLMFSLIHSTYEFL